jgi:hypothetical protein
MKSGLLSATNHAVFQYFRRSRSTPFSEPPGRKVPSLMTAAALNKQISMQLQKVKRRLRLCTGKTRIPR